MADSEIQLYVETDVDEPTKKKKVLQKHYIDSTLQYKSATGMVKLYSLGNLRCFLDDSQFDKVQSLPSFLGVIML